MDELIYASATELARAIRAKEISSMRARVMKKYDIIICPVHTFAAMPHGAIMALENLAGTSYTITYNLTGWPGVVVRGGTSPEGLPIGVQVVARPWREDVALAVAQHIETVLGGWKRPPL